MWPALKTKRTIRPKKTNCPRFARFPAMMLNWMPANVREKEKQHYSRFRARYEHMPVNGPRRGAADTHSLFVSALCVSKCLQPLPHGYVVVLMRPKRKWGTKNLVLIYSSLAERGCLPTGRPIRFHLCEETIYLLIFFCPCSVVWLANKTILYSSRWIFVRPPCG